MVFDAPTSALTTQRDKATCTLWDTFGYAF